MQETKRWSVLEMCFPSIVQLPRSNICSGRQLRMAGNNNLGGQSFFSREVPLNFQYSQYSARDPGYFLPLAGCPSPVLVHTHLSGGKWRLPFPIIKSRPQIARRKLQCTSVSTSYQNWLLPMSTPTASDLQPTRTSRIRHDAIRVDRSNFRFRFLTSYQQRRSTLLRRATTLHRDQLNQRVRNTSTNVDTLTAPRPRLKGLLKGTEAISGSLIGQTVQTGRR